MALSGTDRGTGTHNTGATSFTLSPASNFSSQNSLAVLCVAADNSSSGGSTNDITSVTDSIGNTWTSRSLPIFDNGAASAGVQGAIYTTAQNVGALVTGTVITVNFGSSPVAKTWTLSEVAGSVGKPEFVTQNVSAGQTTASPTVTTGSITNGDMVLAAIFVESGTTQTFTGDADTSNGNWSTQQTNKIGSTTSGSGISSQYKVVTGTAAQTYNPTLGISSDCIQAWISIHENPDKTVGLTGVAGTAAAGLLGVALAVGLTGAAAIGDVGYLPVPSGTNQYAVEYQPRVITEFVVFGSSGSDPNVTLGLTGVSATGTAGTLAPSSTLALTGAAGTGSVGTLTPATTQPITGVAGTGAAGTATQSTTIALTGVLGTDAVGTVTASGGTGGDVTLALTGVSSTGSPGTVTPSTTLALMGVAGTSAAGSLTPSSTNTLTGTAGTGAAGTLTPSATKALTGSAGTGAAGSPTPSNTVALTGVSATGAVGTVTPSGGDGGNVTLALTGVSSTGSVGTVSLTTSKGLTNVLGTATAGTVGQTHTVALTGTPGAGQVGTIAPSAPVTVALSGVSATGEVGTVFVSSPVRFVNLSAWPAHTVSGTTWPANTVAETAWPAPPASATGTEFD